jgi:2-amino-4-hydroxy-6-hydroxymethyldihydropteridine diphosphokinase
VRRRTLSELAFIAIGSNIEPEKYLPLAVLRLNRLGKICAISTAYQNPAIGDRQQPDYLNAAALIETELAAVELRARLRKIEAELGRVRTTDKYADRTIDLDLCLLGSQILKAPKLILPDPQLLERAHLAIPMAEVAPHFRHPITGETLDEIAKRLRPGATLIPHDAISTEIRIAAKIRPGDTEKDLRASD